MYNERILYPAKKYASTIPYLWKVIKQLAYMSFAGLLIFSACKKKNDVVPITTTTSSTSTTSTTAPYNNHSSPLMIMMHKMDSVMANMTMTMDPDIDFAALMKLHHQGAVEMSNYEISNGSYATIKSMAQGMKNAQTKEIARLDSFVKASKVGMMNMTMMDSLDKQMKRMSVQADAQTLKGQSDHDFVHLMIPHHQSAVDMARSERLYGKSTFLKNMAQMMIDDQNKEIAEMQSWLKSGKD